MSQNYSRRKKPGKSVSAAPKKHIKSGLSALQKTIALIGSILSIIVASITINNYLSGANSKDKDTTSTTTVIISENSGSSAGSSSQGSAANGGYDANADNNQVYGNNGAASDQYQAPSSASDASSAADTDTPASAATDTAE